MWISTFSGAPGRGAGRETRGGTILQSSGPEEIDLHWAKGLNYPPNPCSGRGELEFVFSIFVLVVQTLGQFMLPSVPALTANRKTCESSAPTPRTTQNKANRRSTLAPKGNVFLRRGAVGLVLLQYLNWHSAVRGVGGVVSHVFGCAVIAATPGNMN